MPESRIVIRNGFVVSVDPEIGDVPNCDILVEDGRITAVGTGLEITDAEEIGASGTIVDPCGQGREPKRRARRRRSAPGPWNCRGFSRLPARKSGPLRVARGTGSCDVGALTSA